MEVGSLNLSGLASALAEAPVRRRSGRVVRLVGTLVEAELPGARVGEECTIEGTGVAETVGFREERALLMPFRKAVSSSAVGPVLVLNSGLSSPGFNHSAV